MGHQWYIPNHVNAKTNNMKVLLLELIRNRWYYQFGGAPNIIFLTKKDFSKSYTILNTTDWLNFLSKEILVTIKPISDFKKNRERKVIKQTYKSRNK